MQIGAQFYTVRDFCKDTASLSETLKKVADIGYRSVQLSGICECDPDWLKAELDKNGLVAPLTHTDSKKLYEMPDKVTDAHKILGSKYVGLGWCNIKEMGMDEFCKTYLPAADYYADNGLQFMYHNHDLEFEKLDGKLILMQLAERFSARQLMFTVDTFWAQAGGYDPAKLLYDLKGRTPCIHLKDMTYNRKMEAVGEGNMNWDDILKAAEDCGVEYAFVEQDNCNGEDPFDCLLRSYEYLKSKGLN